MVNDTHTDTCEEYLEKTINELKFNLENFLKAKEKLKDVKIKERDFAIHKIYGKVLVKHFAVMSTGYDCKEELLNKLAASVITLDNEYIWVDIDDLIPISETTKVLYG